MEDNTTIREIASDGNVVLVVGQHRERLRVCSRLLAHASKPFAAMFQSNWKEGSDLSENSLVEIPLPEDDPEALRLMCAIIHHRNEMVSQKLASATTLRVAIAADKYDCVSALAFASRTWLRLCETRAQDRIFLAAAAYLLRDAESFRETTRSLVLDHDGSYLVLYDEEIESVMPWKVLYVLEGQRSAARLRLAEILVDGINYGGCCHKCGWNSKYAYAYLKLLEYKDLWPTHLLNISKAIDLVDSMHDPIPEERSTSCTYEYKHLPPKYREDRRWKLDRLKGQFGLCLFCVRVGVTDVSPCQINHRD